MNIHNVSRIGKTHRPWKAVSLVVEMDIKQSHIHIYVYITIFLT